MTFLTVNYFAKQLPLVAPSSLFDSVLNVSLFPAGNYMFKVRNKKARKRCEKYSKLTIKTLERC